MSQTDEDKIINAKFLHDQKKKNIDSKNSSSGFHSFFRWLKKDERSHRSSYHTTDLNKNVSCESVYSTATTGFSFFPPNYYNNNQPEKIITPGPYTDSYKRRLRERDRARELDKQYELTLRKKYKLFATAKNNQSPSNRSNISENDSDASDNKIAYSELSLPNKKSHGLADENQSNNSDEGESSKKQRRTVSESSRFLKAGAYVHVKGKRKAPPPPSPPTAKLLGESSNTNTLSPSGTLRSASTTLRRKKGLAPPPPSPPIIDCTINNFPISISTTSLFDDADIRAIIGDVSSFMPEPDVSLSNNNIDNSIQYADSDISAADEIPTEAKNDMSEKVTNSDDLTEEVINKSTKTDDTMQANNEFESLPLESGEKNDNSAAATSTPLSRPWYKRSNNSDSSIPFKRDIVLKTLDKKKVKAKKSSNESTSSPAATTSRRSFFDSGPKFNFFFHKDSSRKKEREIEARKSGINIPNISELDREASEILSKDYKAQQLKLEQQNEEFYKQPTEEQWMLKSNWFLANTDMFDNKDETNPRRQSTKDLISKFESASNKPKTTINPNYLNGFTQESLAQVQADNKTEMGPTTSNNDSDDSKTTNILKINPSETKTEEVPSVKSADNVNELNTKSETWKCPNCTLENSSWRIICEICEKIKPLDIRPLAEDIENKRSSAPDNKPEHKLKKQKSDDQERKTEQVLKYFFPKQKSFALSKSSSESVVSKSPINSDISNAKEIELHNYDKATINNIKFSPDNKNRNMDKKLEMTKNIIHENEPSSTVATPPIITDQSSLEKEKIRLRQLIRDMNAKALAKKYPVSPKVENAVSELSNNNLNINSAQNNLINSNNNNININNNSHNKTEKENNTDSNIVVVSNNNNNLGAIRKKPLIKETILVESDKPERSFVAAEKQNKMENLKVCDLDIEAVIPATVMELADQTRPSSFMADFMKTPTKTEPLKSPTQLSESLTTYQPTELPRTSLANNQLNTPVSNIYSTPKLLNSPIVTSNAIATNKGNATINELRESYFNFNNIKPVEQTVYQTRIISPTFSDNSPTKSPFKSVHNDQEKVAEMTKQLRSDKNLKDFKASLKFPSQTLTRKESMTLNKLIRDLENAIYEGRHNVAANLAIELAKMKVSLSVTRHKNKRYSDVDDLTINLYIEDQIETKGPYQMTLSPELTIYELKEKLVTEYHIPRDYQKIVIHDRIVYDDKKSLIELGVSETNTNIYVNLMAPEIKEGNTEQLTSTKALFSNADANILSVTDSDEDLSDIQNENSIEDEPEGAAAVALPKAKKAEIIDNTDGCWTCPLCTLINSNYRLGCLACSATKPASPKEISKFNHYLPMKIDESIVVQPRNNLNVTKSNRKSTEVFNIIEDESKAMTKDQHNLMISTIENIRSVINLKNADTGNMFSSPNITKNKYRGVDNFNPNTAYAIPKVEKATTTTITTTITPMPTPIMPELPKLKYKHNKVNVKVIQPQKPIASALEVNPPAAENHYKELLNLDTTDAISNMEPFECPICFVEYEKGSGIILRDCLHIFCKDCLVNTIQYNDEAVVKCPYANDEYSCESLLQEREIKFLVTQDIYEKHLSKSIRQAELKIKNAFHCKTPNCRGWCIYEDNVNQFTCPVCKIKNCLTCQVVHDGLNCKQYQDQMNNCDNVEAKRTKEKLHEMVEKGEAMNCPTCQVIMMKKWGCDWLKCTMCKTEICWITRGPRWGPGGKGDTTGGCKCGVDGKKCHPKCNYCH